MCERQFGITILTNANQEHGRSFPGHYCILKKPSNTSSTLLLSVIWLFHFWKRIHINIIVMVEICLNQRNSLLRLPIDTYFIMILRRILLVTYEFVLSSFFKFICGKRWKVHLYNSIFWQLWTCIVLHKCGFYPFLTLNISILCNGIIKQLTVEASPFAEW